MASKVFRSTVQSRGGQGTSDSKTAGPKTSPNSSSSKTAWTREAKIGSDQWLLGVGVFLKKKDEKGS